MTDETRKSTGENAPDVIDGMIVQARFVVKKKQKGSDVGVSYLIAEIAETKTSRAKGPSYMVKFMHNGETRELARRDIVPMYVNDDVEDKDNAFSLELDGDKQPRWPDPELPQYNNGKEMADFRTARRMEALSDTSSLQRPPKDPRRTLVGGVNVDAWFDIDTLYEANVGELVNAAVSAVRQTDNGKDITGLLDITDTSTKKVATWIPSGGINKQEMQFVHGHIGKLWGWLPCVRGQR